MVTTPLWPLEARTMPAGTVARGLLRANMALPLTLVGTGMMLPFLWFFYGPWTLLLAFPLARLLALDLTAYVLPNLYTVPLILMGVLVAFMGDALGWKIGLIIAVLLLREVALRVRFSKGLGGGDFMLLAAMIAWLPPLAVIWAVAAGCLAWLPFTFLTPKQPVPFGVPLILGWLAAALYLGLIVTPMQPI